MCLARQMSSLLTFHNSFCILLPPGKTKVHEAEIKDKGYAEGMKGSSCFIPYFWA